MDIISIRRRIMFGNKKKEPFSKYQRVEYIESTGTQYISTGYCPNQNTVLIGKYNIKNLSSVVAFVRWNGSPTYDTFGVYIGGVGLTTVYYGRYSDHKYLGNIGGMVNKDVDIELGKNIIKLNNVQNNISRDQFQSDYPLYLFAGNDNGGLTLPSKCVIYSMTIRENDTDMLNLIPCYRKSDGEIGLYDTVNRNFLVNQGTGAFLKGANA